MFFRPWCHRYMDLRKWEFDDFAFSAPHAGTKHDWVLCMSFTQVFFSHCYELPGWCVIMQKDPRHRRILPGAFDSMVGVEESDGERSLVTEYHIRRGGPNMCLLAHAEEVPASVVDALPRFDGAPRTSHRMPT